MTVVWSCLFQYRVVLLGKVGVCTDEMSKKRRRKTCPCPKSVVLPAMCRFAPGPFT